MRPSNKFKLSASSYWLVTYLAQHDWSILSRKFAIFVVLSNVRGTRQMNWLKLENELLNFFPVATSV